MIREIKQMILNHLLGDLLSCHFEMPQETFIKQGPQGAPPSPQSWRQKDYEIPSVTLDLGTHIINLLEFVTGTKLKTVSALVTHSGEVESLQDNILAIGELTTGTSVSLGWNKISLGKRNGLRFEIYGSNASIAWSQENPEQIYYTSKNGAVQLMDRSHNLMTVASQDRYQRFKVGHPAGFIEAFANVYLDIAQSLQAKNSAELLNNPYTHDSLNSANGLEVLEAIHQSSIEKKWVEIKH